MSENWRSDFAAAPPFAALNGLATSLASDDWPSLDRLNALADEHTLRNAAGLPLRFVKQDVRCGQLDYERSAFYSGRVPTRERNWHDLFNALVWLTWPRVKAALNAVQCARLQAGQTRSPISDAATLFDESGLVLVGEADDLMLLLRAHRWQEAFVECRADWSQLRTYVIGHAVLEKLLAPWPGIVAKCLYLALPADSGTQLVDAAVATLWQGGRILRPAELFPLPVLGVPGWWPANADPAYYADTSYFRPARVIPT